MKKRKLFCEYGPLAYKISFVKEVILRDIKDYFSNQKIAKKRTNDSLKYILKGDAKILFRKLEGVDMKLQKNKVTNLKLAAS